MSKDWEIQAKYLKKYLAILISISIFLTIKIYITRLNKLKKMIFWSSNFQILAKKSLTNG